jgi:hypothetical protein
MREFLAMQRIALVRVVGDELALVLPKAVSATQKWHQSTQRLTGDMAPRSASLHS